jgi:hypothetical protein
MTYMTRAGQRAETKPMAWRVIYWTLIAAFLLTAALNMLHVRAGFLTNYLADLTVPALLYVVSRRLVSGKLWLLPRLMRWIGRTPARAAAVFFLASAATEMSQIFWPRGVFAGRFDPWDLVAYSAGLLTCYVLDKMLPQDGPAAEDVRPVQ